MEKANSQRIEWSVIIVILIGTFMAILNGSIVNVALPRIMAIFNASPDRIQWVLTVYIMTLGVIMPITGYLGDTFGYKRMYFVALSIFTLGSALCGLSWNVNSLVAARIIQAVGGGIMQPLGMAFIYRVTPRERIGTVMGIWGIAAMAAPAIGPTLGGYLVEYVNWRLIFYVNVPIGIANLFLATVLLKETPLIKGKRFDMVGLISSTVGLFCLLLALSQGNRHGWSSLYIVSLLSLAAVTLTLFVYNELNHSEPLLELRLFQNRLFSVSIIVGSVLNIGMFGAMFLLPLLLQNVFGQTAMKTGLILFPAALVTAIFMPISGRIFDKYGARGVVMVGLILVTGTTYKMGFFNEFTPFAVMSVWLVIRGIGMGLSMMPVTTVGMTTVPMALIGRGSALGNVIRQVAASLGIAMFTTIMQNRQVYHYHRLAESVDPHSTALLSWQQPLNDLAISQGWSLGITQVLQSSLITRELAKQSMVHAIGDCFLVASAFCLLAVILAFMIKEPRRSRFKEE